MSTQTLHLPHGTMTYEDVGTGPALVFVHGALVDGELWRRALVPLLRRDFRCVTLDLPFGAHRTPVAPGTDLTPPGLARIVAGALDALGLEDVTLVGNDTGGAICQLVAARHPERLNGLVLTNCDAYESFPPKVFRPLRDLSRRAPGLVRLLLGGQRLRPVRTLIAGSVSTTRDDALAERWLLPSATDAAIGRDAVALVAGLDAEHLVDALPALRSFPHPVLLAWAPEDPFFPVSLAERLARDLPNAELVRLAPGKTFVPVDQAAALARAIRTWATLALDLSARTTRRPPAASRTPR